MPQSSLRSISNDYARLNGSDYGHRTGSPRRGEREGERARPCKDKTPLNLVQLGAAYRRAIAPREKRARNRLHGSRTPFPRPSAHSALE